MAQYKKYGKSTNLVYTLSTLLAVSLLCVLGLLTLLVQTRPAPAEEAPPPQEAAGDSVPVSAPAPPAEPEQPAEKEKPAGERTAWEILADARLITHGMGEVDGITTLNCLEGFLTQYEAGVRVFEADLRLTRDCQVVLRHDWWHADWQEGISWARIPTREKFVSSPILGRYTPLSFRDLLLLMEEYPDICIITDTKFTDAEIVKLQFEAMVRDGAELGLSYLFDRMIIQVYDQLMFRVVDSVRHFDYYIYTLYTDGFARTEADFREKADFCAENGIMGITMWDYWWREDYASIAREKGLKVFAHTVNDPEQALALLAEGVSAVYTDELTPGDLAEEPETYPICSATCLIRIRISSLTPGFPDSAFDTATLLTPTLAAISANVTPLAISIPPVPAICTRKPAGFRTNPQKYF